MPNERTIQDLMRDVNAILAQLFEIRSTIDGAINWADLSCCQAARGQTDAGQEFWAVWIEEASPDNYEFQTEIQQRLFGMNWDTVQVITEW